MKQKDSAQRLSPSSTVVAPATNSASSRPYLAKVRWTDTVGSYSWDLPDDISTAEIDQWGWVVHHDGSQLKLADTKMEGDWYGVTAIPAGCIVSITVIGD